MIELKVICRKVEFYGDVVRLEFNDFLIACPFELWRKKNIPLPLKEPYFAIKFEEIKDWELKCCKWQ